MTATIQRRISQRELDSRLGVSKKHAYLLQDFGGVGGENLRPGPGRSRMYTPKEALALWAAWQFRPKGFAMPLCGRIGNWVLGLRWHEIARQVAEDRYLIMAVGHILPPPGRLLGEGEVFYNPHLPIAKMAALPLPFGILDVRPALKKIQQFLDAPPDGVSEHTNTGSSSSATEPERDVA